MKDFIENRKRMLEEEENFELWDEVVYDHEEVDISNPEERKKYVEECLHQMQEASGQIDALMAEYNQVTAYLTDMEEIEQLPPSERKHLQDICYGMDTLSKEQEDFEKRKCSMSDEEFYAMQRREDEIEAGIAKIEEAEQYRILVKKDLKRLDNEKNAYRYRKAEVMNEMANFKGMCIIILISIAVCFLILLILQFGFGFEAGIGYLIAGAGALGASAFLLVRYKNSERDLERIEKALHRLVTLKNTVKIRYVNNTTLLEYLCMKYGVKDGKQLKARWNQYTAEKEERASFGRTEIELQFANQTLMKELERYNLKYPEKWLSQTRAIMDSREMVEIRHELILERQSLRKRLDYNKEIAESAKNEVMDIAKNYPAFTSEISEMIAGYEKI